MFMEDDGPNNLFWAARGPKRLRVDVQKRCRVAVVGAGQLVGISHCRSLKGLEGQGVELTCICQRQPDDTEVAERFGAKFYTNAYKMAATEGLDGVVIAAPTHLHLPLVLACIAGSQDRQAQLGKRENELRAILVEKPLCEDLASAMKLAQAAEEAGIKILVGHQRRHSAFVKKARDLVTNSNFGPLRGFSAEFSLLKPDPYFAKDEPRFAWRGCKGKGGPVLINLIHDVDLLRFITGHEVVRVFAATSGSARANDVEDTGAVTVVLDHGAVGTCLFSDAAPSPWSYEFTTLENKKYPPVPGSERKDCYHFLGAQRSLGFPSLNAFKYGNHIEVPGWDAPLSVEANQVTQEDPLTTQMSHFVRVCRGLEEPICSARDGLESLAVIMAILHSADTQEAVCPGDMFKLAAKESSYENEVDRKDVGGYVSGLEHLPVKASKTTAAASTTFRASEDVASIDATSTRGSSW
jgi:predicted dehydrogenase